MGTQRIKNPDAKPRSEPSGKRPIRRQRKHAEPDIGTRIKALAVLRGFSLRELSAVTGVNYDRLRNIVYGVVQEIHSHELQLVVAALDANIDWLVKGRGDPLYSKHKPPPPPRPERDSRDSYYDFLHDPKNPWTQRIYETLERESEDGRKLKASK